MPKKINEKDGYEIDLYIYLKGLYKPYIKHDDWVINWKVILN